MVKFTDFDEDAIEDKFVRKYSLWSTSIDVSEWRVVESFCGDNAIGCEMGNDKLYKTNLCGLDLYSKNVEVFGLF